MGYYCSARGVKTELVDKQINFVKCNDKVIIVVGKGKIKFLIVTL